MGKNGLSAAVSYLKRRYLLAVWSFWIVLLVELLSRSSAGSPFDWLTSHFAGFLLNVILVFALTALIGSVIGRVRPAYWIVTAFGLISALISGVKLKMLGVPLLPWDLAVAAEGGDMVKYVKNIATITRVGGLIVFLAVSYVLLYRLKHSPKKLGVTERGVLALVSAALIALLYLDRPLPLTNWLNIKSYNDNQALNVRTNGYLLATVFNIKGMHVSKPAGYSRDAIAALASAPPETKAGDTKPNIIVILSESFFDPTIIPGLKFSRDPLPVFHQLQKDYTSGTMLTPQFGSGTANVEFEVLTGNSMRFLPQGSVAYNQFVNKQTDSLASILTRQGYASTAISPFHNWYYKSNNIYKYFGFGKYISIEYFNPVYNGPYITDVETAKNIIKSTGASAGSDFVFANTMENHFHYYPGKFKENTIKVDGVTGESLGMIETYAQGLIGADNMLKELVDYYTASGEPTILLWFGDHLPYLGDDYQFYKDAKYISGKDDPDFLNKIFRTPVLVWDNYLPKHKETLDYSPSFLGPLVLEMAQRPGTYYTDFLRRLSRKTPVIPPQQYYDAMHVQEKDLKQYETLQYDILFGEQHGYERIKDQIVDPDYHLGYGPISIESVAPASLSESDGSPTITVSGAYLPAQSVLYWNGKPLTTTWPQKDNTLTAKIPPELLKAGTWELQAKLSDSKETVLAQSKAVQITVKK